MGWDRVCIPDLGSAAADFRVMGLLLLESIKKGLQTQRIRRLIKPVARMRGIWNEPNKAAWPPRVDCAWN